MDPNITCTCLSRLCHVYHDLSLVGTLIDLSTVTPAHLNLSGNTVKVSPSWNSASNPRTIPHKQTYFCPPPERSFLFLSKSNVVWESEDLCRVCWGWDNWSDCILTVGGLCKDGLYTIVYEDSIRTAIDTFTYIRSNQCLLSLSLSISLSLSLSLSVCLSLCLPPLSVSLSLSLQP